jgi:spermidine synthase
MGLEIMAGRLLAPAFGSSVFVWGSVIGVFLVALSAGYAIGGNRASEHASRRALVTLLSGGAVFTAFLVVGDDLVISVAESLPIPSRYAAIIPVAVLFGPLTFLLGFVSPYVAELSTVESHGSASGRVYAVGTIGSIVGSFGTTFFLIPTLEIWVIEGVFAVFLVAVAGVLAQADAKAIGQVGLTAIVVLAAIVVSVYGLSVGSEVVYEDQTAYSELEVVDDGGVRTLYLDGIPHSASYTDERAGYVFTYTRYAHLSMLMRDDVDSVLFIGGGGFTQPQRFVREYPDVEVDVVEIDPGVVYAAEQYFGLRESNRLDVHVQDGRTYLEATNETYDVVVLDAYQRDRVPFHLTTVEFLELVHDRLDDDGVVVANTIGARTGPGSRFWRAEYKTMQQVFPHVYAFPTADTPYNQNIELVATKQRDGFTQDELREVNAERQVGVPLSDAISRYQSSADVRTDDVPVLRDSYAPVDSLLAEQVGEKYVVVRTNGTTNTTTTTANRPAPPVVG